MVPAPVRTKREINFIRAIQQLNQLAIELINAIGLVKPKSLFGGDWSKQLS
jgi:hypothetical protein